MQSSWNSTIHYATPAKRFWALIIDYAIIFIIYLFLIPMLSQKTLTGVFAPLELVTKYVPVGSWSNLPWLKFFKMYIVLQILLVMTNYAYAVYLVAHAGQTLGKKIMGIRVISLKTHKPPRCTAAFIRETVGKFASGIFFGLGFFWIFFNEKHQTWHDKIAGTIVVDE